MSTIKITRNQIRDLVLKEGLLKAGPIRFDFNREAMKAGKYATGLPDGTTVPTGGQLSNLRGAMIIRAMIDANARSVASISEDFAADLVGGVNTNSRAFGDDNSKFVDVVAGNKYYSVKFRSQSNRNEFAKHHISALMSAIDRFGDDKEYGVVLIDSDDQWGGLNGAGFTYYESNTRKGSDLKSYFNSLNPPKTFSTLNVMSTYFNGWVKKQEIKIATPAEINSSIKKIYALDWENKRFLLKKNIKVLYDKSGKFNPMGVFVDLLKNPNATPSSIVEIFPFFGSGLGAAASRADSFINTAGEFLMNDTDGSRRQLVYKSSSLMKSLSKLMKYHADNPEEKFPEKLVNDMINRLDAAIRNISTYVKELPGVEDAGGISGYTSSEISQAKKYADRKKSSSLNVFDLPGYSGGPRIREGFNIDLSGQKPILKKLFKMDPEHALSLAASLDHEYPGISDSYKLLYKSILKNRLSKEEEELNRTSREVWNQQIPMDDDPYYNSIFPFLMDTIEKKRLNIEKIKNQIAILNKEKVSLSENKKLKNGCIPARRKISSGGKAGTYADARTGGKQAYAALKKAKPGSWSKKKNVCLHKCSNDRSAPNGYVCINPAHLCWGSKGDNTTDQWHGNGTACRSTNEEKLRSDIKAMIWDLIPEEVLKSSE